MCQSVSDFLRCWPVGSISLGIVGRWGRALSQLGESGVLGVQGEFVEARVCADDVMWSSTIVVVRGRNGFYASWVHSYLVMLSASGYICLENFLGEIGGGRCLSGVEGVRSTWFTGLFLGIHGFSAFDVWSLGSTFIVHSHESWVFSWLSGVVGCWFVVILGIVGCWAWIRVLSSCLW